MALVALADIKAHLNILDTGEDSLLTAIEQRARGVAERFTGRTLEYIDPGGGATNVTEFVEGQGTPDIYVRSNFRKKSTMTPTISVRGSVGAAFTALDASAYEIDTTTIDETDARRRRVLRLSTGDTGLGIWDRPDLPWDNIKVQYHAGYIAADADDPTPLDLQDALLQIISTMYRARSKAVGAVDITGPGEDPRSTALLIPSSAKKILDAYVPDDPISLAAVGRLELA